MKYYGIYYNETGWHLLQSRGFESLKEAERVSKEILSWSNNQSALNIIHESWIECLADWPTPEEQEEARLFTLSLKNQ